ncbi:sugar isomerase [Bacillus marasmi]|uniref:sugar isomerase n=1 Tax=Bacillus marasmi TaxID=1926279 RepID=UPI0011C77C5A|nr:sugar isomerase [Bacillus marasmi]
MKAKRSILNIIFGLTSQLIIISLGVVIPRLFLVNFGSEVNGFLSSITQIMVYMTLFEAGVGAASLQALYKPISGGDKQGINSILAATSKYYRKTGIYYFITVIIISIGYPLVVKTSLPTSTIVPVILLTGLGGALNYYFVGKYRIFLVAEGKNYIETSIVTVINILINVAKIVLLLNGFSIIAVQAAYLILSIIQVVVFLIYIRKNYQWLDLSIKPDFEAISQKNSALVHQFSTLIFSNTTVLILTLFTNLKVVSVYVMYNLLFSIIDNVIITINSSLTAALGQTYHESRERFLKFYDVYETYFMAIIYALFTIAYILILPFMKLYTAGITDINYIDTILPVLFIIIKLLGNARISSNNAINIAGHFKKTQNRSLLESGINIVFTLIFVQIWGIYGALMGTITALLYRSIDMIVYSSKNILERSPLITSKRWFINVCLFLLIIFIAGKFDINPTSYIGIVGWASLLVATILPTYLIVSSIFEKEVFLYSKAFFNSYFNKSKQN